MKREFAALIGAVFLVSAIPFQLMGWTNMAGVLGLIGVAAGWKSGDQKDGSNQRCKFTFHFRSTSFR